MKSNIRISRAKPIYLVLAIGCLHPPSASEGLVEVYQCEVFIAYGVAHTYLCFKIAALRIEDVNVVESAGPVLEVRKVDIFACRVAKVGLQYGGLLHAAVGDDGIVDFLERCKHALLVCQAGLVVCGYRCLVFAFLRPKSNIDPAIEPTV